MHTSTFGLSGTFNPGDTPLLVLLFVRGGTNEPGWAPLSILIPTCNIKYTHKGYQTCFLRIFFFILYYFMYLIMKRKWFIYTIAHCLRWIIRFYPFLSIENQPHFDSNRIHFCKTIRTLHYKIMIVKTKYKQLNGNYFLLLLKISVSNTQCL